MRAVTRMKIDAKAAVSLPQKDNAYGEGGVTSMTAPKRKHCLIAVNVNVFRAKN